MVASDAALFVFVLCPLNILPVQIDDDGSSGAEALWAAGSAVPMLCPVHRSVQIVRFWSASVHGAWSKIHVHSP